MRAYVIHDIHGWIYFFQRGCSNGQNSGKGIGKQWRSSHFWNKDNKLNKDQMSSDTVGTSSLDDKDYFVICRFVQFFLDFFQVRGPSQQYSIIKD